jgi:hypothetical protein
MNRCKKHKNFTVTERVVLETTHVFVDGRFKESLDSDGKKFGTVLVRCSDCGLMETCQKSGMPKWLKRACLEAGIVL